MAELQPVPSSIRKKYSDWSIQLAWTNVPECTTWRLHRSGEVRYLKAAETGAEFGLERERKRLAWSQGRLRVPRVLEYGRDPEQEWLVTSALRGRTALERLETEDRSGVVRTLANGLRSLHETPARDCPFLFDLEHALESAEKRVASGAIDPHLHFHAEFRTLAPVEALERLLAERPGSEDVVLCHGDYCLPNLVWEADERVGYLDVGNLGLADRWWDLAVATWSLEWNLGPGWDALFLETYGVGEDPARREYFRLLYDLVS